MYAGLLLLPRTYYSFDYDSFDCFDYFDYYFELNWIRTELNRRSSDCLNGKIQVDQSHTRVHAYRTSVFHGADRRDDDDRRDGERGRGGLDH
jgi:hypothetical protein